jgi:hypothetical protein
MAVSRLQLTFWTVMIFCSGLAVAGRPDGGYHLLKKYELGAAPGGKEYWDYITFDASTRRLYISHNTEVKVVDADTGAIGHGTIYDNVEDKNEVVAIDSRTNTVKSRWPIAPAEEATAIDLDAQHHRLFIGGRNKVLAIMNVDSGKVVQTFPIGAGVDTNIYEPSSGTLFVAAREGTLHVYHEDSPDSFRVVETVKTEFGARNMALDPKTHQLFIDTADFAPAAEPTTEQPHPQPTPVSGTFRLLVYGR